MHISDEVNVFPHISDLVFEITGRLWQQMEEMLNMRQGRTVNRGSERVLSLDPGNANSRNK